METRTVKTVSIFLASSSELSDDRVAFADFIERLQNHYKTRNFTFLLKKWEYMDPAYNKERKQNEYNEIIKQCDMFVVIFHTKLGEYTLEEFDVAFEECRKRNLPLFIYFRNIEKLPFPKSLFWQKKESKELIDFKKNRLIGELNHFWGTYDTSDRLHLDFVLWLDNLLFGESSNIKVENNEVTIGNVKVAEMSQLSFAKNCEVYQQLNDRINSLRDDIKQLWKNTQEYPEDKQFSEQLRKKVLERNDLLKEFERQQEALLGTAKYIAELKREQISEKLEEAIDAFDSGKLDVANKLLNELQKEGDRLAEEIKTKHEQLHNYIEGLRLQTQTIMADVNIPISERVALVSDIYAKADDWSIRSAYNKEKYRLLLYDYSQFLEEFAQYEQAVEVCLREIKLTEELYGLNSIKAAISYNNIGLVYYSRGEYINALECYNKAFDIFKDVVGEDDPSTAYVYNNIGLLYHSRADFMKQVDYNDAKQDYDKALSFYLKAKTIRERHSGPNHHTMSGLYNNIGGVYYGLGELDKALDYYFQDLDVNKDNENAQTDIATSYNNIGLAYYGKGEFEKALEYHLKSLKIRELYLGTDHPETAMSYTNIGMVYFSQADLDKSLEFLRKALTIFENSFISNHPYIISTKRSIAIVNALKSNMEKDPF